VALKALQDVQDAERRAEELIEKARAEGRNALQAAEKERQEAFRQAREEAQKTIQMEITGASEKAREKIAALREQHLKELEKLQGTAQGNLDRAVEMVLEVLSQT